MKQESEMKVTELSIDDLDQVSGGDLGSMQAQLWNALVSMNEISDAMGLRLQMAMDHASPGSLSNFLKQIGTTQSAITQNLK
jgi:hypothetical protein